MKLGILFLSFVLFIISILTLAGNGLGVECYNKNGTYKTDHATRYNMLIGTIGSAILTFLIACIGFYLGVSS